MAPSPEQSLEGPDLRLRLASIKHGFWLTVVAVAGLLPYWLLSWERPHRSVAVALTVGALLASLIAVLLPMERIMHRTVLRESFFLGWTTSLVAFATGLMLIDGGAGSPISTLLFLPMTFVATSYPTPSVIAVGTFVVVAFTVTAVVGADDVAVGEAVLKATFLTGVAGLCAWSARLQAIQRAELATMSRTDPLTGALNRRGFQERLTGQLAQAGRSAQDTALVLVDLDDFKQVNDSLGHAAGDKVLRRTAAVLQATVRPGDAVGRLGGDEFAVLLADAGTAGAAEVVTRLRVAMGDVCRASYGIASAPLDGIDADALHHHADVALYAAKREAARSPAPPPRTRTTLGADAAVELAALEGGELAVALGRRLGLDDQRLAPLRLAALLADIGKSAIPKEVLDKPGPLSEDELALVRTHAPLSERMVRRVGGLETVASFVRHSHEHVDGSGYPDGLTGDAIPLESRILLVADAFEAMTSPRPHRPARTPAEALDELARCAGTQFDAMLVDVLAEELLQTAILEGRASSDG